MVCYVYGQMFTTQGQRKATYWVVAIEIAAYLAAIVAMAISCWKDVQVYRKAIYEYTAITDAVSTFIVCLLPLRWIWSLKMSSRKKLSATLAFTWAIVL